MPSSFDEWYDTTPDLSKYYQGDVLRDIPFPYWSTFETANDQHKWAVLRPLRSQHDRSVIQTMKRLPIQLEARARSDISNAFHEGQEYVVGKCKLSNVQVISRACQLDYGKRKHLVVAPITAIESLPPEQRSEDKLKDLRAGKIPHYSYLPANASFPESFSDLHKMTSIHRTFLPDDDVQGILIARLSSAGMAQLQRHISTHFGKQFGFDHTDIVPQNGRYACSNCFHLGNSVVHREFTKGNVFGACETCGEDAAFVKFPSNES